MTQPDMPTPPWERPPRRRTPARVPLTRERIVDAAYTVLDRDGYDRLSMRQVAAELGVAVSALYVHVHDKDELLQLMYTRMFEGYDVPEPDPEHWREQVKDFARQARERMLSHRDLPKLAMGHVPFTPELLPYVERLLAVFAAAGIPRHVLAISGDLLSTYINGFALEETVWQERYRESQGSWDKLREEINGYFASLPPDRFPNLVALADIMMDESNDYRFELGLEIILRGLASYIGEPEPGEEREEG
ncbi:TetR/AcrR family transcriptional regulator [Microbispora sp. SCL1-1]|uniref:TetR/AcrR family transcriptional regulator n=1 Tax=unclassified Microbispora TaxID=2614687 RepID=UPI0011580A11|nr:MULTISPECIES: TetR/AcrR family transcriptional regulator [unclassified Microbispora]NJP23954.1 TetR/AcrR family transcriptional regulator [Microbispora sp. CL1-1]TQS15470.1 TetR/AcrR family transcriptional regulator [Microbispora sp. SCL1-1]